MKNNYLLLTITLYGFSVSTGFLTAKNKPRVVYGECYRSIDYT